MLKALQRQLLKVRFVIRENFWSHYFFKAVVMPCFHEKKLEFPLTYL
jgi:hypothetical protein